MPGPGTNTSFAGWDWHTKHVEDRLKQGEYVSAETVLIAAGPPRFEQVAFNGAGSTIVAPGQAPPSAAGAGAVYPVGLLENFGLSQNKQLQRLFEIGSKRSYFVPGRNIASFSLGRVLFWGPSLMRVMYAYYPHSKILLANGSPADETSNEDGIYVAGKDVDANAPNIVNAPGTVMGTDAERKASFYINLASDLFNQPLGLMVYMKDVRDQIFSAFYLEDCYIQAHQLNLNASSVLVAEGVSGQCDQVVPVDISGS
jgi:hypothetical protein